MNFCKPGPLSEGRSDQHHSSDQQLPDTCPRLSQKKKPGQMTAPRLTTGPRNSFPPNRGKRGDPASRRSVQRTANFVLRKTTCPGGVREKKDIEKATGTRTPFPTQRQSRAEMSNSLLGQEFRSGTNDQRRVNPQQEESHPPAISSKRKKEASAAKPTSTPGHQASA